MRRWTQEETLLLIKRWGQFSLASIARRLRRTTWSTYQKAHRLDLLTNAHQGFVPVEQACKISGYSKSVVKKLVKVYRPGSPWTPTRSRRYGYVDTDELRMAVEARLDTETIRGAARARGWSFSALRQRAIDAGYRATAARVPLRLPSAVWDELVARPRLVRIARAG